MGVVQQRNVAKHPKAVGKSRTKWRERAWLAAPSDFLTGERAAYSVCVQLGKMAAEWLIEVNIERRDGMAVKLYFRQAANTEHFRVRCNGQFLIVVATSKS